MEYVNGLSRRSFLSAVGAVGVISALPGMAFAQPKRGGTLSIGIEGASTGDTLDPRSFNSPYWAVVSGTIFNTLVEVYGPSNELRPGLAKSWEGSDAGKRWCSTWSKARPSTTASR